MGRPAIRRSSSNRAPIEPAEFAALLVLVWDGGVVATTAWMPVPDDADRGIRASVVFVLPVQLSGGCLTRVGSARWT